MHACMHACCSRGRPLPAMVPPLDYTQCNPNGIVNDIPFLAGLTNGLKMLLLLMGVIKHRLKTIDAFRSTRVKTNSSTEKIESIDLILSSFANLNPWDYLGITPLSSMQETNNDCNND
jgi:hypothetical protein